MCCPLVFEFSVGIGGFCHRTGSDLLLFHFNNLILNCIFVMSFYVDSMDRI